MAEWFDRFRGLCERRGVDVVTVLPERLTGTAYATWDALTAEKHLPADRIRAALLDAYMPSWAEAYEEFQARKLRPGETAEEYLQALRGLAALFINGPVQTPCWTLNSSAAYQNPAGYYYSKFCRLPGIPRSDCRGQDLRNKLCLARALASQISPFKRFGLNL